MSRTRRPLATALVVALIAVGPLCGALARAPRSHAATAAFGVASLATLIGGGPDAYQSDAQAIRDVKAKWIRIFLQWHKIEPSPGNYDWSTGDNAVAAAAAKGLNVLVCITGPAPIWAQQAGADPAGGGNPPADPAAFGAITRLIADRYKQRVSAWEIWNEPNVPAYFTPVDVGRYAALLQQAYVNIHAAQPQATVMSGGLSSYGIPSADFVRQLYDAGAGNFVDAVALHPYTFPFAVTEDPRGAAAIADTFDVMASRGQAAKKIWITEYGQATGTSSVAVSDERQAQILTDFLNRMSTIPYLGPSFLFTTRDLGSDPSNPDLNYGLYTVDFKPKPVVAALQALNP